MKMNDASFFTYIYDTWQYIKRKEKINFHLGVNRCRFCIMWRVKLLSLFVFLQFFICFFFESTFDIVRHISFSFNGIQWGYFELYYLFNGLNVNFFLLKQITDKFKKIHIFYGTKNEFLPKILYLLLRRKYFVRTLILKN